MALTSKALIAILRFGYSFSSSEFHLNLFQALAFGLWHKQVDQKGKKRSYTSEEPKRDERTVGCLQYLKNNGKLPNSLNVILSKKVLVDLWRSVKAWNLKRKNALKMKVGMCVWNIANIKKGGLAKESLHYRVKSQELCMRVTDWAWLIGDTRPLSLSLSSYFTLIFINYLPIFNKVYKEFFNYPTNFRILEKDDNLFCFSREYSQGKKYFYIYTSRYRNIIYIKFLNC